jgi:hypothetical protein
METMSLMCDFLTASKGRLVVIYTPFTDDIEGRIVAFDDSHVVIECLYPTSMHGDYLLNIDDISGISCTEQAEIICPAK